MHDVHWTTYVIVTGCAVCFICIAILIFRILRRATLRRISNELLTLMYRSKELRKMRVHSKMRMDMALNMYKGFDVKIYDIEGDGLLKEMTEDQLRYMSEEIGRFQKLNQEINRVDCRLHTLWAKYPHLLDFDQGEWDNEDTPIRTRTPPPALH